jgi:hypothetical protein
MSYLSIANFLTNKGINENAMRLSTPIEIIALVIPCVPIVTLENTSWLFLLINTSGSSNYI